MNLKVRVHQGRLGTEQYRVVRPATPVTGAVLGDNNPWFVLGPLPAQTRNRPNIASVMELDLDDFAATV